ncbi:MAG: GlyGly-CTERM sorting domain-containing protein [Colwellia sp.]|nr:GlyGly-CTERM sorting domain-containing protein [Colwellia sp.]
MKKMFKCSSIPLLSKLAKATMIALPCALLSTTMAYADPVVIDFPTVKVFDDDGVLVSGELTQYYLNHIYSAEWGNNLIVNPSFDLCGEYVDPKVYVMVETRPSDNPETIKDRRSCEVNAGFFAWSWTYIGFKIPDPAKKNKTMIVGNSNVNHPRPPNDRTHYAPPNHSRKGFKAQFLSGRGMELIKAIEVTDVNEIYTSYDFAKQGHNAIQFKLVLTPTNGEPFELDLTPEVFDDDSYWTNEDGSINNYWYHGQLAWQLDAPFTGTIDYVFQGVGANPTSKLDNIFLGTDTTILPLPDSDEDGTHDGDDDFRTNHVAYLDSDGDGLPDFFTAPECKPLVSPEGETEEGEVIPAVYGDDYAECNGLTLDTDDDNDGDSDIDEVAAGTDPLDDTSILADLDADGWYNANDKDLPVADAYPDSHYLFLAKEKYTNVLTDYAADAETAVVIGDFVGSESYEWSSFSGGSGTQDYDVIDTTGRNGESTKAFRLGVSSSGLGDNIVELKSPTLTTVNQNVRVVRLAGWVKITGPELIDDDTRVSVGVKSTRVDDSEKNNRHFWSFTEGSPDRAIYNIDPTEENDYGWYYFDQPLYIGNDDIADIKMSLQLETKIDIVGIEVLFDDVEMNLVPLNISRDQDADGILNGDDATPLGDGAFDAELGYAPTAGLDIDNDGILNGYDDDLDGDGIANAFDNFHLAITIDEATPVHDAEARTITIDAIVTENSASDPAPESDVVLEYNWTVKQEAKDDNSAAIEETYSGSPTLVIDELDFVGGINVVIELTVTAVTPQGGTLVQKRMWEQDIADDEVPTIEISMVHTPGENAVFSLSSLYDEEDDALLITWTVDGASIQVSENATSLTLEYADYSAAASVVITATVSEVNRPVHTSAASLVWFIPAEPKTPYDGNKSGSMNWWLLALLSTLLFTRRSR